MTKRGAPDRESVLVADGDELVRWSVAEGLREQGYSVAVTASAREALRRGRDAAVALLGEDLPDADGLAAAEELRRRHPQCAVVLMTADPTRELCRRARASGVAGILGKPFSLETLVATIRGALERPPGPPVPKPGTSAKPDGEAGHGLWSRQAPHEH